MTKHLGVAKTQPGRWIEGAEDIEREYLDERVLCQFVGAEDIEREFLDERVLSQIA